MNTQDDNTDIKFRKLFGNTGLESPSAGFTGDVMNRIMELETAPEPGRVKSLLGSWMGGIGIGLLAILGLAIVYYFGINLMPAGFTSILTPVFENIYNSFKSLFDSVSISNTTLAIILGFSFLVVVERILNYFRYHKNTYFSF